MGREGSNAEQGLLSRRGQHPAHSWRGVQREALGPGEKGTASTQGRQVCKCTSILREAGHQRRVRRGKEEVWKESSKADEPGEIGMKGPELGRPASRLPVSPREGDLDLTSAVVEWKGYDKVKGTGAPQGVTIVTGCGTREGKMMAGAG